MEYWDLYDADRQLLRRNHPRGEPICAGAYHLVVSVWTVNAQGDFLITLRDPVKEWYGGVWENTGGAAQGGEESLPAALRELREETGIAAGPEELIFLDSGREATAFIDTYLLFRDVPLSALILQPGETVDARWVTAQELWAMAGDGTLALPVGKRLRQVWPKMQRLVDARSRAEAACR